MKKVVGLGSVVLLVLLVSACSEQIDEGDLPPEPAAPYSEPNEEVVRDFAGQASYPFEVGFASPLDVYEEDQTKALLFSVAKPSVDMLTFSEDTFTFPLTVTHPGGLVYKYGYVYTKSKGWDRYEFPQAGFRGSNWIVGSGNAALTLSRNEFDEGDNWVVAYSCKKHAGRWRCGMQQKDGSGNVWMLQKFTVLNAGAPDEPIALQNVCTDTDSGKVEGTRGTTTGVYVTGTTRTQGTATDTCVDANRLEEWYCTASGANPVRVSEVITCANGCENGACKAAAGTPTPTTGVDFAVYYASNEPALTAVDCFTASGVVSCDHTYSGTAGYGYYGRVTSRTGYEITIVDILYGADVKYTMTPGGAVTATTGPLICSAGKTDCTFTVPGGAYAATGQYTARVKVSTATTPTPTTTVSLTLNYGSAVHSQDSALKCFTVNSVIGCYHGYSGTTGYVYTGQAVAATGYKVDAVKIFYGGDVKYTLTPGASVTASAGPLTCASVGDCTFTVPGGAYTYSGRYTAKVEVSAVAASGATTFAVCKMPLRDTPSARPAHLQDVTDANAEEKCAALAVFGKADGTAYSPLATGDLDTAGSLIENLGQSNEKLVCALSCATGRNVITACKDIAADPTAPLANPYYRPIFSTCS